MWSGSLILLNFGLNQTSIIEKFCENTDKPELKCNGKCHLSKQIKEDTEKKSETPATINEVTTIVLAKEEIPSFEFKFFTSNNSGHQSPYLEPDYSNQLQSVFHPPQV